MSDAQGRKVFLIVDNLRVHKAVDVTAWLPSRKPLIELFYLPPYTPETHPDEVLTRDLKTELRSRAPAKDRFELCTLARNFMEKLKATPGRVRRYFEYATVQYADQSCF